MIDYDGLKLRNDEKNGSRISISLNNTTLNNLDDLCKDYGLTRSAMFSFILNDFFMKKYQSNKN